MVQGIMANIESQIVLRLAILFHAPQTRSDGGLCPRSALLVVIF